MHGKRFTIREARLDDADAIDALAEQLGYPTARRQVEEQLARLSQDGDHLVLVAESHGDGVVGWIHLLPRSLLYNPALAEIGGLVVDEQYRNTGIGRALVRAAEQWAQSNGYSGIVVRSNVLRQGSHEFYPRVGYQLVKSQRVYSKEFKG